MGGRGAAYHVGRGCTLPRVFVCYEAQSSMPAARLGGSFACSETWQMHVWAAIDKYEQMRRRVASGRG